MWSECYSFITKKRKEFFWEKEIGKEKKMYSKSFVTQSSVEYSNNDCTSFLWAQWLDSLIRVSMCLAIYMKDVCVNCALNSKKTGKWFERFCLWSLDISYQSRW